MAKQKFKGVVTGPNRIVLTDDTSNGTSGTELYCYRHKPNKKGKAVFKQPLILNHLIDQTVGISATLQQNELHDAFTYKVYDQPDTPNGHEAQTLNDLLEIRHHNRKLLEKFNGTLGTALGKKFKDSHLHDNPAILVFVPQKIALELLPPDQHIPKFLENEDQSKWCHVDVVSGGRKPSLDAIDPVPSLTSLNEDVTSQLQSGWPGLIGGMQVGLVDEVEGYSYVATAGVAVQWRQNPDIIGFLTNHHVGGEPGNPAYFPSFASHLRIGETAISQELATTSDWYDGHFHDPEALVRCDFAVIKIDETFTKHVLPGVYGLQNMQSKPYTFDPASTKSLDVLNQKVVSVGRTRGFQRGTIVAYAYEFVDEEEVSVYTDFLIASEAGDVFSWKGDSGKLILTDDEKPQPIALLWGGWQEKLRNGRAQEMWSYAIDLNKVLKRVDAKIMSETHATTPGSPQQSSDGGKPDDSMEEASPECA